MKNEIKILNPNDEDSKIEIKQLQRTRHFDPPISLVKIAEKYTFCEWDSESKNPMRIMLKDNLDKYGVVWFQSPTCFQIKLFSYNKEMLDEIEKQVIKIIKKTMTPSIWEKFLRKIGKDREELRKDAQEVRDDYIKVREKIKGAVK